MSPRGRSHPSSCGISQCHRPESFSIIIGVCVGFGSESGPYSIDDFFDQSPSSPLGNFRQDHRMHRPPVLTYLESRYRITQSIRGTDSYENLNVTMGRQGLDSYKGHPSLSATVLQVYRPLFQCICEADINEHCYLCTLYLKTSMHDAQHEPSY